MRSRRRVLLAVLLLAAAGSVTWVLHYSRPWEARQQGSKGRGQNALTCGDVLAGMTAGRWVPRTVTPMEQQVLEAFLQTARDGHHLPPSLQRPDGLCGNVTFSWLQAGFHDLLWFRALCDPKGSNPCCRDGRCQNFPSDQCRCDSCYDLRQDVNAELATWTPRDPACRLPPLSRDQVCDVLRDSHVIFVGDSFVRHVYTALLMLTRDLMYGALSPGVPEEIRKQCVNVYMFTEVACRMYLLRRTELCDGKVNVSFHEYATASQGPVFAQIIKGATQTKRSFVIAGIGIHNDYNAELVWRQYLQPALTTKGAADWPKLLWLAPHCPGLLKTPRVPQQSRDYVMSFNDVMGARLRAHRVPILDTWQMTEGVTSFDGAHYGLGVNAEKVTVIVRYLQELSRKGKW